MAQLVLIRHGQTDWNLEGRYQGQADIPLNATGLAQAEVLAEKLGGQGWTGLYASNLQRALQTAGIVGARLGLPIQIDTRLREICQGEWEGQLYQAVVERYARAAEGVPMASRTPADVRPPGGESVAEVAERVASAADDIARRHPGGPVLIVGHGLALTTLICRVQGIPLGEVYAHIPENTHPVTIEWPPQSGQ